MNTQLLPHNVGAYNTAVVSLKQDGRTCIVHPTGTGKSFLIAAISESYGRVLILAPNRFAIGQIKKATGYHDGIDYMTYSLLTSRGVKEKYDLIVLDEFHRVGAQKWGKAVQKVIDENPDAKVCGTSATPIRYLDKSRDMSEEIFHGNVASIMTLGEAWSKGILPIPTYVTGLFDFSNTINTTQNRIEASKNISKEDREERVKELKKVELEWNISYGMPTIIRKHIGHDVKRIIVFCDSKKRLPLFHKMVEQWFEQAGIKVASIHHVHYGMSDTKKQRAMDDFKTDTDNGVKIMLTINMLNESVHIPNVGAIIMLRTTSSRIIYMQQLGRCLASNTTSPVVLDMVDNITAINIAHSLKDDFEKHERKRINAGIEVKEPRTFAIFDYLQDIHNIIEKLSSNVVHVPIAKRIEDLRAFIKKNGRVPAPIEGEEAEYRNWVILRAHHRDVIPDIIEKYGRSKSDIRNVAAKWSSFCWFEGRMPKHNPDDQKENYLYNFFQDHKGEMLEHECVRKQYQLYGRNMDPDAKIKLLQDFFERHGRRPSKTDGEIYTKVYRKLKYSNHPKAKAFFQNIAKYDKKKKPCYDEKIQLIKDFCEKNGRTPKSSDGDIYKIYRFLTGVHRKDERVQNIINTYHICGEKKVTERLAEVVAFCERNNRLPNHSNDLRKLMDNYPDHPIVKQLYKTYK